MKINDGLGIFCYDTTQRKQKPSSEDPFTKVVVLTNNDLSNMFSNDLRPTILDVVQKTIVSLPVFGALLERHPYKNANIKYMRSIVQRRYNYNDDDQPIQISEQIGILGEATFRLISGFNASNFYNDDTHGVRIYFNVKGREGELVVGSNDIVNYPNVPEVEILTGIANRFREEIIKLGIQ